MRGSVNLRRKLVLEARVRTPDMAGGYTEVWVAQGTVRADLRPGTGRARDVAAVSLAYVPYRVIVRASPVGAPSRPVPGQRFRDGTRLFHILAVSDGDRDARYLDCFTKEEVLS